MMQQRIIVFLHPLDSVTASWVILNSANKIIHSVSRGDLVQLSTQNEAECYVFVPAQEILLTQAEIPKLSRQRMLQALPFALEEVLIEDVNELHFAPGDYQTDGKLPVAIVSKQKMTAWLQVLEQVGLSPTAFIPAVFILPFEEKTWQVNSNEEYCIARTGKFSGFACEKNNLKTLIEFKLAEEPEGHTINLVNNFYSDQELLEQIAPHIKTLSFINLLQGAYHPKPQSTKIKKIWLIAGYLAAALITLAFFSNIISYLILSQQNNKVEAEINQIYKRNFPQASSVVAPRERMTEKLRTLTGEANKNNFLVLLSAIGRGLNETPSLRLKNLDFREQQLTLEVIAASFDNLDSFTKALNQQGFNVKQQNAAVAGTQVKATLLIRAGKP